MCDARLVSVLLCIHYLCVPTGMCLLLSMLLFTSLQLISLFIGSRLLAVQTVFLHHSLWGATPGHLEWPIHYSR